jgi:hypothetical protein
VVEAAEAVLPGAVIEDTSLHMEAEAEDA